MCTEFKIFNFLSVGILYANLVHFCRPGHKYVCSYLHTYVYLIFAMQYYENISATYVHTVGNETQRKDLMVGTVTQVPYYL